MATQTGSIDLTASNSVKIAAEAGWQSDLEDYYTKSEIDVTVSGINSTVSTKVGEDEVISSINQSSESVSISANKINLTGAVTISDLASDASTALADAAETATSYVTELTGEDGIMVHPSTDDDTGVQITSDVDILRNGYSVINVGTRGDTSGNTDSGVTIYDGSGDSPSNAVVTFTGEVDSAGRRRSYIDTGDPTDGSSAAEVIGTVEDADYGSYVLRRREMELFAYAPNGTGGGSVSAWAQTSTDGTFDESGVALYGKWLNLNHESSYISVPMEQAGAMLSVGSETLTRGSGASSWSDGTVRRSGKVVTVTINGAKLASALASGGTSGSITTIPTGYTPSNLQRGTACLSTTGNYANVWFVVGTTGNVAIANRSSLQIPTTAEISFQVTYVIE